MFNSFGNIIRLTTFGESHGECVGGVLDGYPAGVWIDEDFVRAEMRRRRPGQSGVTTGRHEADEVEFLSGVFEGRSTGAPLAFIVRNQNARTADYADLGNVFRPSHADFTYYKKYGVYDYRGGGRASARETVVRCAAGALAKIILREMGIRITAYTAQVGNVKMERDYHDFDLSDIERNAMRCPDMIVAGQMERLVREVRAEGDSIGGIVACVVSGCPVGLGEPIYHKLHAALGNAMLSINAARAFELGNSLSEVALRGSDVNDIFYNGGGSVRTMTNHSAGIQGGISNGEDIFFRVLFKPAPTISQTQKTVRKDGQECVLQVKGRHDPCVLPRAVPVVEAMTALVLLDYYLMDKIRKIEP